MLEGTTPVAQYPRPGLIIDRTTAGPRIMEALLVWPRPESVTLDIVEETPTLSIDAVDTALDEARLLLAGRVTLTRTDPDATLFLSEEQLAKALITRVERVPSPHLVVTFDPVVFDEYLQPLRAGFEVPPVDARIVIDNDENITITPGFPGALIDTDLVVEAAEQASRRANQDHHTSPRHRRSAGDYHRIPAVSGRKGQDQRVHHQTPLLPAAGEQYPTVRRYH